MNQQQSLGFLAVIAVVAGLAGVTALGDISFVENDLSPASVPISGHMIIQVTDDEGNIKNYMQSDNIITASAKACTGNFLFSQSFATCVGGIASPFDDIVLSSDTFGETATTASLTNAGFTNQLTGTLAKSTTNTITESIAASGLVDEEVKIVHTFSYTGGGTTVASAALMNDANGVFAIKKFPSAVSLNNGDDLTVTWLITLG